MYEKMYDIQDEIDKAEFMSKDALLSSHFKRVNCEEFYWDLFSRLPLKTLAKEDYKKCCGIIRYLPNQYTLEKAYERNRLKYSRLYLSDDDKRYLKYRKREGKTYFNYLKRRFNKLKNDEVYKEWCVTYKKIYGCSYESTFSVSRIKDMENELVSLEKEDDGLDEATSEILKSFGALKGISVVRDEVAIGKIEEDFYEEQINKGYVPESAKDIIAQANRRVEAAVQKARDIYFNKDTREKSILWKKLIFLDEEKQGFTGLDGTFLDDEILESEVSYFGPISYFGSNNLKNNASYLYAIVLDIDEVPVDNLDLFIRLIDNSNGNREYAPRPTYIVNSGTGIHLYYILNTPLALKNYIKDFIHSLKNKLVHKTWVSEISNKETVDNQRTCQMYRVVDSSTKLGLDYKASAYKVGEPIDLDYFNDLAFLNKEDFIEFPLDLHLLSKKYKIPFESFKKALESGEIKEDSKKKKKKSNFTEKSRAKREKQKHLYYNLINRMEYEAKIGHRYGCFCVLFADAYLTGIPMEDVFEYGKEKIKHYNRFAKTRKQQFTMKDITDASVFYSEDLAKWVKFETLTAMTGMSFKRNKRNNRTQEEHLTSYLPSLRSYNVCKDTRFGVEGGNVPGRPAGAKDSYKRKRLADSAEGVVREYLIKHKDARKIDVIKGTGLVKSTVYRHYDKIKAELYGNEGGKTAEQQGKSC